MMTHPAEWPVRVTGGCGRQADGTAGLPPAPEIPVRSRTYASCQQRKRLFDSSSRCYGNGSPF
jgi:hypothetical protein